MIINIPIFSQATSLIEVVTFGSIVNEPDGTKSVTVVDGTSVTVTGATGSKYAGLTRTFDSALLASGPVNIGLLPPTDDRANPTDPYAVGNRLVYDVGLWAYDPKFGNVSFGNEVVDFTYSEVLTNTDSLILPYVSGYTARQTVTATQGAKVTTAFKDLVFPQQKIEELGPVAIGRSILNNYIDVNRKRIETGATLLFALSGASGNITAPTINGNAVTLVPNGQADGVSYGTGIDHFSYVLQATDGEVIRINFNNTSSGQPASAGIWAVRNHGAITAIGVGYAGGTGGTITTPTTGANSAILVSASGPATVFPAIYNIGIVRSAASNFNTVCQAWQDGFAAGNQPVTISYTNPTSGAGDRIAFGVFAVELT